MKSYKWFFAPAVALSFTANAVAADITGRIILKGKPPAERILPVADDPFCARLFVGKQAPTTRFYVVDKDGGLADTFVYLKEGLEGKPIPSPGEPVVLEQSDCFCNPYVFGLQTQQVLMVKNLDPFMHTVHISPSRGSRNKESVRATMAGSKPALYVFQNPEIFLRIKGDARPWMFAYAAIVDHPYFAVSGVDGTFKISDVPPGEYVVEAVHRRTHPYGRGISKKITVGTDTVEINFTIDPEID